MNATIGKLVDVYVNTLMVHIEGDGVTNLVPIGYQYVNDAMLLIDRTVVVSDGKIYLAKEI